jgi:hypothetical protein
MLCLVAIIERGRDFLIVLFRRVVVAGERPRLFVDAQIPATTGRAEILRAFLGVPIAVILNQLAVRRKRDTCRNAAITVILRHEIFPLVWWYGLGNRLSSLVAVRGNFLFYGLFSLATSKNKGLPNRVLSLYGQQEDDSRSESSI